MPNIKSFVKAASFEEKQREPEKARIIYERAMSELGNEAQDEHFLIKFIKFEIKQKHFDRAKTLFKYALSKL
jgi:crooked neck